MGFVKGVKFARELKAAQKAHREGGPLTGLARQSYRNDAMDAIWDLDDDRARRREKK